MSTFEEALNDQVDSTTDVEAIDTLDGSPDTAVVGSDGQADSESAGTETSTEPSYLDLSQFEDQMVQVKVDGEMMDVPVSELSNGYMRQEAFTRKTQALAEERSQLDAARALASAYAENPQETVRFLADQNGITLAQAAAVAEQAEQESWADTSPQFDPRVDAIEARMAELDRREAKTELENELQNLGTRYGEDFNANEVVARAIEARTDDLEGVYKQMAFDRMMARQQAATQAATAEQARIADVTTAKQQLADTVATGNSFGGAGDAGTAPINSVASAFDAAEEQHGKLW